MLMMLPLPAATIVSPKTWHGSSAPPTRLRSKTSCQPSSGSLQKSPPGGSVAVRLVAAGAVDQHGDRAPLLDDGVAGPGQRIAVHGVGRLEDRLAARRLDGADALLAALLVAADDGDARPGRRQRLGHRAAQDAGAAEDDGDFVFQIEQVVFHSVSLPCHKQRLQVALVEVLVTFLAIVGSQAFEHLQVAVAHLRGDLVADVDQLPQVRVERRAARIVPQRGDELLRRPARRPSRPTAAWPRSMSITAA